MCFHIIQNKDAQTLQRKFKATLKEPELFTTSDHYNAFDFPKTPVITVANSEFIEMAEWGLIPEWADDNWNRTFTLNARIESLDEKPAFRDAEQNRCLVLVNGFYEWQHQNKIKIKYRIGFDDELFALGGIYTQIEKQIYYSIVTTEAQGIMREIHNTKFRMPFALKTDEEFEKWLHSEEIQPRIDFTTKALGNIQTSLF